MARRFRTSRSVLVSMALAVAVAVPAGSAAASSPPPEPGSVAYLARDTQNVLDAYGRITGPGGQLTNPRYLPALIKTAGLTTTSQLLTQVANPTRLALTAGQLVPGWSVGNPLRSGWNGTRGVMTPVSFTNRYGALLRGTMFTPKPGATDPYTGAALAGPFPGVVITPGSVQGSAPMYHWVAQDLAERGYVTFVFDVQGQGTSETLPHTTGSPLPFCSLFAPAILGEQTPCPGVPFQQPSNFVFGTQDAIDFFMSTPDAPYANVGAAGAKVNAFNPVHAQFDRSEEPDPFTPGRTTKLAIMGHSLGAAAVSQVQGIDERVATVVALDKLNASPDSGLPDVGPVTPVVPGLGLQAEYGFTVAPYALSGGSSLLPLPSSPNALTAGPDPMREKTSGFEAWQAAGVDSMVVVPRASTHLEYTDIPLVLPASRYGQALSSAYIQAWLGHYLKHESAEPLTATSFPYLEPQGGGVWKPITLQRDANLSFYYCSAFDVAGADGRLVDEDVTDLGCAD